jgi:hypothetical protein
MKALYPPLSYAIFIALSIAALLAIMTLINAFTDSVQRNYASAQLSFVSETIRDEILKLYSTNATGTFQLEIPRDIAGRQYSIEMSQNDLNLSLTIGSKKIEAYRLVNISASMSGTSYPPASIEIEKISGNTIIRLVR